MSNMKIPERFKHIPKWIEKSQGVPNGCIREMARIYIEITDISIESVQSISDEACLREGIYEIKDDDCTGGYKSYTIGKPIVEDGIILSEKYNSAYEAFETLWDRTARKGYKWEDNPNVAVYKFKRVKK